MSLPGVDIGVNSLPTFVVSEMQVRSAKLKWKRFTRGVRQEIADALPEHVHDVMIGIGPGHPRPKKGETGLGSGFPHPEGHLPKTTLHRGVRLVDGLSMLLATHGHFVSYFSRANEFLPRLNKDKLHDLSISESATVLKSFPDLRAQVLMLDLDLKLRTADGENDGSLWTPEALAWFESIQQAWIASGKCSWIWYLSEHGVRILQPLDREITLDEHHLAIRQFIEYMRPFMRNINSGKPGFYLQWDEIKQWNGYFSGPSARKSGGRDWHTPVFNVSHARLMPLELLEKMPIESPTAPGTSAKKRVNLEIDMTNLEEVDRQLAEMAKSMVDIIGVDKLSTRHHFYLYLSGAFLHAGLPAGALVRLVSWIAKFAGHNVEAMKHVANSTAAQFNRGGLVGGFTKLRKEVLSKLDKQQASDFTSLILEHLDIIRQHFSPKPEPAIPLDALTTTRESLFADMRKHADGPGGVKLVVCETGFGKSELTRLLAHERAMAAIEKQEEMRARSMLNVNHHDHAFRTSYSAPTNALAEQYETKLLERGTSSTRRFGALSVESAESGMEPCQFRAKALPLINGGQNITRTFCGTDEDAEEKERDPMEPEPVRCPFRDTCQVRHGLDANTPKSDLVHIVNHAMIRRRAAAASMKELVVIDEPAHYREAANITDCDRENFNTQNNFFQPWFVRQMRPFVHRVLQCKEESFKTVGELFRGLEAEAFELLYKQNGKRKRISSAPIEPGILQSFKKDITHIDPVKLGAASRVYNTIFKMVVEYGAIVAADFGEEKESDVDLLTLARKFPTRVRLSTLHGQGDVLQVLQINRDFAEPLLRSGPTLVLDANANTNRAAYEKILGYELPEVKKISVDDAVPIERTHLKTSMSRAKMFHFGKIDKDVMSKALTRIRRWIEQRERTLRYGLITYRTIALVILAAKGVDIRAQWKDTYGHLPTLIYLARLALGPALDQIDLGERKSGKLPSNWFGAIRGLDHMKDLDGVITLGDAWPNMDEVRADAELLGFDEEWVTAQLEMRARDELEQAHGRLRTVYRTKGGRSLHVGHVCPGGTGWSSVVDVVRITVTSGPIRRNSAMDVPALQKAIETIQTKLGLATKSEAMARAAKLGGRSIRTIQRWLAGESPVTEEFAAFVSAHLDNWADEELMKLMGWDKLIA